MDVTAGRRTVNIVLIISERMTTTKETEGRVEVTCNVKNALEADE